MMRAEEDAMDGWADASANGGRLNQIEDKLIESARKHLGDERVVVLLRGQTHISPVLLPLLAPLLFFFLVKPRTVIITETSVVTVQESVFLQSRVARVVSHHPRGSVPIRRTRLGLKVGEDATVFAMPGSLGALGRTVDVGSEPTR